MSNNLMVSSKPSPMPKFIKAFAAIAVMIPSMPCLAQNSSATHPNKQTTELPPFEQPEAFELPPVQPEAMQSVAAAGISIQLKQIQFEGNEALSDAELEAIARPYLEQEIDVTELEELRFKLTQYYISQGYINSGAIIPEQNLDAGILKIKLIEGRLSQINVTGQGWLHPDYLRMRLSGDDAFNVNELQDQFIQLLNDPLIENLNANYKPLAKAGESALDLKVRRKTPYQISAHYNNYNPPSIGSEQLQFSGWVRNLTRWGDKFDFSYEKSEGADSFAGGFEIPLTAQGTKFEFNFNVGQSSVIEQPLDQIDIKSKIRNFSWTLSHPLIKENQQQWLLGASFASRRSETSLFGESFPFLTGIENGRTLVTVIRLFQEYMMATGQHILAFRSTLNIGIDSFDSTIQKGHNLQDSEFFSWLSQLQYAYQINDEGMQVRFKSNLQLADEALLPQERIAIGGVYSVRGYRENELVRDNGFSGSLEFHYPLPTINIPLQNRFTLVPFMDYGLGWNHHSQTDELHSVGIGLNWELDKYLKAEIYYAHDLITAVDKTDHNLQDEGVHFNVSVFAF